LGKQRASSGHSESDNDKDVPQSSKRQSKKRQEHHSSSTLVEEVEDRDKESDIEEVKDKEHEGISEGQGNDEVCTSTITCNLA